MPAPRLAATVAALLALAGACGGRTPVEDAWSRPATAADTLRIGVTAVSTGRLADTAVLHGVQLAVDRLNAERPPGGPPLGVRVAAPRHPGEVAAAAVLRDDPSIVAVVGPTGSSAALDDAPVFADVEHDGARAVASLAPTATNPAVSRTSPWLFRVCPSDEDAAAALAAFIADSLGARRAAVIFRNDVFGRGFTRRIAPALAARGVQVTERDPYLAGATRYEAYAARIARDGADALLVAGNAADAAAVARALHAAGARPALLGTDDVAAIAGRLAANPDVRGLRFVTFFAPDEAAAPRAPEAAEFVARFRARHGRTPDHRSALSYDAALLAGRTLHAELAALAAAGRTAPVPALRRAIRDRLARVGREDPVFEGAAGPLRFDAERGAVGRQVWIGHVGAGETKGAGA